MLQFKQDRRLSRDTLILCGDRLIISTNAAGLKAERTIVLKNLAPDFERKKRVCFSFIIVPLLLVIAMAFAASKLLHQQAVPKDLVVAPLIGLMVALWYVAAAFRPVEIAIFRNKAGAILLEVYRPKGRRIAYEEFVSAVVERVNGGADQKWPIKR